MTILCIFWQVDFIVFCSGLIFPLTICISLTQQRKDLAISYLSIIKTEIRSLRIMFTCFNKDTRPGELPAVAKEAEPVLRNIVTQVMCMCRNDQDNQLATSIWLDNPEGANAASHYISDGIAQVSALLGRTEREYPIYDKFKDGWAVRCLRPQPPTTARARRERERESRASTS